MKDLEKKEEKIVNDDLLKEVTGGISIKPMLNKKEETVVKPVDKKKINDLNKIDTLDK